MEAIILAGGLGTRLRSRVADRPKSMAQIAGRPFLEILLDRLVAARCDRIILSVGYLREVILRAFGYDYHGVQIDYVVEESPLGTGGAIRTALQETREADILVLNGDTYLDVDFSDLLCAHSAGQRPVTIVAVKVMNIARYGGITLRENHVVGFIEKGKCGVGWINGGVYVLNQAFPWPDRLPTSFSFELDVLAPSLHHLNPAAFLCTGFFLDIGVPKDFERAQVELGHLHRR